MLTLAYARMDQSSDFHQYDHYQGLILGNIALASVAALIQVAFFVIEVVSRKPSNEHDTLHSRMQSRNDTLDGSTARGSREPTPPMALQSFATDIARGQQQSTKKTDSARSSLAASSIRMSIVHAIRPVTSKTRLLKRGSFRDSKSIYSIPYSVESAQSDAFDTWDTSSVDQRDKETVLHSRGTNLETIPGSRPQSPARALDGPFPEKESTSVSPQSRTTTEPSLPPSPTQQRHDRVYSPSSASLPLPTMRGSRSSTPAPDESHIHPLFRSDSPAPPEVTPGTTITASPQAGQTLPSPQIGTRSASRPTSPSPLVHSQSFESVSTITGRGRRGSGAPPIPGFVLAEASFAGSEARGRASSCATAARSRAASMISQQTRGRTESILTEKADEACLAEE
jgi:hypothetical protein